MKVILENQKGFTLVDLAVVITSLTLLIGLLLPALSRQSAKAKNIQCLNNGKQLGLALRLYSADNHDFLPPNPDDGNALPGHNWMSGNLASEQQATNINILKDPTRNLLAPYVGDNFHIFKCPADTFVPFPRSGPTIRSVSLSQAVGTVCQGFAVGAGHIGIPNRPVNGPWLDNRHSHHANNPWRTFGKQSDFVDPKGTWVFLDEDYRSINDGGFAIGVEVAEWIDRPSTAHNNAGGFVFADGHSEIHKWVDPRTKVTNNQLGRTAVPGSKDWTWLASRTTSRAR